MDFGAFFGNWNVATTICVVLLLIFAVIGRMKGVGRTIIMLLSIVLATITVALLVKLVESFLQDKTSEGIQTLVFLVLIAFLFWIFYFIGKALRILHQIPIVHGLDCFLGMILGLCFGILIILLLFVAIQRYQIEGFSEYWIAQIEENPLLNFIYHHNFVQSWLFQ
ncbi:MAG: CvpA family protein [Lachnospiraceae bacterium]|nr:CvpA family protein [Candidatus Merdinaster equi]